MTRFIGKTLATGQVSDSQADIYAVPSTKVAIVNMLHVYNTGSTTETVKAYVKEKTGTARQIGIGVLGQNESKIFTADGSITLSSEASIQAITTTASTVDYVVTGAEQ